MAAEHHHQPERARGHETFVHVIHVANWLATAFGYGVTSSETPHATPRRDDIWCKLALEETDIALIRPRFVRASLEQSSLVGILTQAEVEPEQEPDQA